MKIPSLLPQTSRQITGFSIKRVSALVASTLLSGVAAHGAVLNWDPLATGTGGSDGSGTWNNAAPSAGAAFSNGTADVAYTSTVTAPATAATTSGTNTITVSLANAALLIPGLTVSSASFPAGTTISSVDTGTGIVTLSTNSTGAINSGTSLVFAPSDSVIFGAGTGTAGTVTVAGTQGASAMTINAAGSGNYTFTGGTITVGSGNGGGALTVNSSASIGSILNTKAINFGVANQTLTLSGGSTNFLSGATAGGSQALTAKIIFAGGTYAQGGGGSTYNIGDPTAGTNGLLINSGSTVTTAASFQSGVSGKGVITLNGGTVNQSGGNTVVGRDGSGTGRLIISSGTYNHSTTGTMLVGFLGAKGTLDVQGGTLNVAADIALNSPGNSPNTAGGTAVVNISGGTTTVNAINFGKAGVNFSGVAASGSGTLNLTGGSLYIGSGGLNNLGTGSYTSAVNLSGGTVGAKANWTSSMPITLGTTGGSVTFNAANAAGTTASTIGLTGVLSGPGGLKTAGIGAGSVITLSAVNTYLGATSVGASSVLVTDSTGSLGAGNVSVDHLGTLTIGNFNSINDTGDLSVFADSVVNLNFTGAETVHTLFNATTGTYLAANTYDVATLNSLFGASTFASNASGKITVLAVPEPQIWGLLMAGGALLVARRRRRSNA